MYKRELSFERTGTDLCFRYISRDIQPGSGSTGGIVFSLLGDAQIYVYTY